MRVRKKCTGKCGKLKSMWDFLPSEEYPDKKTRECKTCIEEMQFGENNSKINNNQTINTMATLAEKRKAAEAAKAQGTTDAPAAGPKPVKTPTTPKAKVGDTTKDGLQVVGEKKESTGKKGRAAYVEKPIEQMSMDGLTVLAIFPTLKEAADAVGATPAFLLDGLRGWAKSVKGSKWRYEGEEIFVREKKVKTDAEKAFVKPAKGAKVEDLPVPGDLDYDEELHAPKEEVEEEDEQLDPAEEAVFEGEVEEETAE
jgi:hypothetical protein